MSLDIATRQLVSIPYIGKGEDGHFEKFFDAHPWRNIVSIPYIGKGEFSKLRNRIDFEYNKLVSIPYIGKGDLFHGPKR